MFMNLGNPAVGPNTRHEIGKTVEAENHVEALFVISVDMGFR